MCLTQGFESFYSRHCHWRSNFSLQKEVCLIRVWLDSAKISFDQNFFGHNWILPKLDSARLFRPNLTELTPKNILLKIETFLVWPHPILAELKFGRINFGRKSLAELKFGRINVSRKSLAELKFGRINLTEKVWPN